MLNYPQEGRPQTSLTFMVRTATNEVVWNTDVLGVYKTKAKEISQTGWLVIVGNNGKKEDTFTFSGDKGDLTIWWSGNQLGFY